MQQSQQYTVTLSNFEGPLDLLLHLIERRELEITDISIGQVTGDYLAYITALESVAHRELLWFVDIAAKLLVFKSRALSTRTQADADAEDEGDFERLTEQLRILQAYRRAAEELTWHGALGRGTVSGWLQLMPAPNLTTKNLMQAMKSVNHRNVPAPVMERRPVVISRRDIARTMQRLVNQIKQPMSAQALLYQGDRRATLLQLLALLELVKQDSLQLHWEEGDAYVHQA